MSCKCKGSDEVRQAKMRELYQQMDKILGNIEGVLTRMDKRLKCKGQKRVNGRFA